jgi:hypothetical protein
VTKQCVNEVSFEQNVISERPIDLIPPFLVGLKLFHRGHEFPAHLAYSDLLALLWLTK